MAITHEIERKYDVGADTAVPSLAGAGVLVRAGETEVYELDAVYYDTAALDLASQRIALRRREGGHDAGWHIKRAPDAEGRVEEQFPLSPVVRTSEGGPGSAGQCLGQSVASSAEGLTVDSATECSVGLPAQVRAALGSAAGGRPIVAVARVRNRRSATVWFDAAGTPLVEFADDHVRATDERDGTERSWREWEVELIPGALTESADRTLRDALLDEVEARLGEVGAIRARGSSKLQRALGRA